MTRQGLPNPVPPPFEVRSRGGVMVDAATLGPYQPRPDSANLSRSGRIAQRESARFTRERSLVRSQVRPSSAQRCRLAARPVGMVELAPLRREPLHRPLEVGEVVVPIELLGRAAVRVPEHPLDDT